MLLKGERKGEKESRKTGEGIRSMWRFKGEEGAGKEEGEKEKRTEDGKHRKTIFDYFDHSFYFLVRLL